MKIHRNCVTDPLTRLWWRDYQRVCREGNPLGVSFVEYIAARVASLGPKTYSTTGTADVPWYVSSCAHQHPWGQSCSDVTVTQ